MQERIQTDKGDDTEESIVEYIKNYFTGRLLDLSSFVELNCFC